MPARQREVGEIMVEGGGLPGVGGVAGGTIGAIFPVVVIVEQMTGDTGRCRGHQVMGEVRLVPILSGVAERAVFAKTSKVSVILYVTRETIHGGILRVVGPVAVFAGGFEMFALEREIGQVMVESGIFPINRRVADFTVCAKAPFVCIILKMAASAIFRGVFKIGDAAGVLMALRTTGFSVFADQFKTGLGVVKVSAVGLDTVVAGKTIFAIRRNMRLHEIGIDILMALAACSLLKKGDALCVAVGTRKGGQICLDLMGCQRKADQLMREICGDKFGERRIGAAMLGMTVSTGELWIVHEQRSVQGRIARDLQLNLGMAA